MKWAFNRHCLWRHSNYFCLFLHSIFFLINFLQNLAPEWNERFTATVSDAAPLHVKVYDYDRASSDDHMGHAFIDLSSLSADCSNNNNNNNNNNNEDENDNQGDIFDNATHLKLELTNQNPTAFPQEMGFIYLKIHIVEKQQISQQIQPKSSNMLSATNSNLNSQNDTGVEEGMFSSLLSKR